MTPKVKRYTRFANNFMNRKRIITTVKMLINPIRINKFDPFMLSTWFLPDLIRKQKPIRRNKS